MTFQHFSLNEEAQKELGTGAPSCPNAAHARGGDIQTSKEQQKSLFLCFQVGLTNMKVTVPYN